MISTEIGASTRPTIWLGCGLMLLYCLLNTPSGNSEVLEHIPDPTECLELVEIVGGDTSTPTALGTHLDLALDAHGGLFVTDPDHHRVLHYRAAAERLKPVPVMFPTKDRLFAPQGIAIDAQGRLFLTTPDLHELLIVDANGTLLGGMGGFDSPFERPIDVAIGAEGHLYVLDQTTRAVVILAQDGRVLQKHRLPAVTEQASRSGLTALAVAGDGTVDISDANASQILRLTPSGAIHRLGKKGYEVGEIISPEGVAVDTRGNIIVSDAVNNALYKFAADGGFLQEYVLYKSLFQQPSQLALQGEHL